MLRTFAAYGVQGLARLLERTPAAVRSKARELDIDLTEDPDSIDLRRAPERAISWVRKSTQLRICPSCSVRLATMHTGVCRPCHLDRLIEMKQEEIAAKAKEKKLLAMRKRKQRVTACVVCGITFFPRNSHESRCEAHR